jgi:cytochrome c oxidase subunit IV
MSEHHDHTKSYLLVLGTLLVLTVVTVWISYFDFGTFNVFIAMFVATVKGSFVCLYFMHLKEDNKVNQVVFISAFVFLAIFVGLTLSDTLYR